MGGRGRKINKEENGAPRRKEKGNMAKTKKTNETTVVVTRAEKRDATKNLIRELLNGAQMKSNDLIDEAARLYTERFGGEETDNVNDVKGRVGSVLDVMKKDGDVLYEGGMYALNAPVPEVKAEEKPKKNTRSRAKKTTEAVAAAVETPAWTEDIKAAQEEKPAKANRARKTAKKDEAKTEDVKTEVATEAKKEKSAPLPAAPLQPIAPTAPITPEAAPEPIPEDKPTPKKRGRKAKATAEPVQAEEAKPAEKTAEVITAQEPVKAEPKEEPKETPQEAVKTEKTDNAEKADFSPKGTVMDMSFLFGEIKPVKKEEPKKEAAKKEENAGAKTQEKPAEKPVAKAEEKKVAAPVSTPAPVKAAVQRQALAPAREPAREAAKKPAKEKGAKATQSGNRRGGRALTADEKLQEAFLNRLHKLGGEYFEYYSIYLLERYSRMNGRRLEGLRVTGGDHDGGIDGEIELTDRLGFRETIYIQAKNWDPDKGDEKLWVVGETLLQQFIGACVCRQAKDGKQHCRGIFITTSRFTPEAKRILDETSDKFVGYDGNDLFEAAKECGFGIVRKNGEWALDDELLSGEKAFFKMF